MLTKSTIRLVSSLRLRKFRLQEGLFVAEGPRLVGELLPVFCCRLLMATREWMATEGQRWDVPVIIVSEAELERVSSLQTPQQVVALFEIPSGEMSASAEIDCLLTNDQHHAHFSPDDLHIALDGVQDPGNLGTIIRLADWFGVRHLWCSPLTVDVWNPKVVQSTMGGIARVCVHYIDLPAFLAALPDDCPIYGTSLDGQSIWTTPIDTRGVIVMGNEGNGLTPGVERLCRQRLFIPNFPAGQPTTDSLNVAMATGIVLSEFRRRQSLLVS